MSDAFSSLAKIVETVGKSTATFVMFTPLKPVGLMGKLRPWRYELHMTAVASSIDEVEEFKTWQLRSYSWRPPKGRKEIAFLYAPVIQTWQGTEYQQKYLVMQYILPSFTGYPRGHGWDAMVVQAKSKAEAFRNAEAAGIFPMKKPLASIVVPVPDLQPVRHILSRPGIGYM